MNGKRQSIIKTARMLFFDQGIVATGMEQIARATPVSKMTIYKYFGNKEGLLNQVIDDLLEETNKDLNEMLSIQENLIDKINRLLIYRKLENISPLFYHDLMESYPEVMARLTEYNERTVIPFFVTMMYQAQQCGCVRKDVSPHLLALYLASMRHFISEPGRLSGYTDLQFVFSQLASLLLHGIVPHIKE